MSDNITLPREVVELALEVVELALEVVELSSGGEPIGTMERKAIAALRTALAAEQPKVSVTLNPDAMRTVSSGDAVLAASSVAVTVSSALAAEQPKPEPVAWGVRWKNTDGVVNATTDPQLAHEWRRNQVMEVLPLYIAPPEDDAIRLDAERYRWLKAKVEDYDGHACFPEVPYPAPIPDRSPFDAVDAAIDAAMEDKA